MKRSFFGIFQDFSGFFVERRETKNTEEKSGGGAYILLTNMMFVLWRSSYLSYSKNYVLVSKSFKFTFFRLRSLSSFAFFLKNSVGLYTLIRITSRENFQHALFYFTYRRNRAKNLVVTGSSNCIITCLLKVQDHYDPVTKDSPLFSTNKQARSGPAEEEREEE